MLLSLPDAPQMFAGLTTVVMDEVHALAGSKRGDQLALCVARLDALALARWLGALVSGAGASGAGWAAAPVGLSATVAYPDRSPAMSAPIG